MKEYRIDLFTEEAYEKHFFETEAETMKFLLNLQHVKIALLQALQHAYTPKRYNYTTNAQKRRTAHFKHITSDIYYLSVVSSCISDMVSAPD